MIRVEVKSEFAGALSSLDNLQRNLRDTVIARTLNRIADQTKTQAVREIAGEFNLPANKVRDRIKVSRAFAAKELTVTITVPSRFGKRALNVVSFGARKLARGGVSVKIKRAGRRQTGDQWFMLTNKRTGGTFVARRIGKAKGAIEPVRTVDVGQMFNAQRTQSALLSNIRAKFPRELDRQLSYAIRSA